MPPVKMERPVSPVSNSNVTILQPTASSKKPSLFYYIMLVILIGLCILTLSIYQSKMDKSATPNLAKTTVVTETAPVETVPMAKVEEAPLIVPEPVTTEQPAPMPEPVVTEPAPQPEPVAAAPVAEPAPMPTPVVTEPAPQPEPVATLPIAEPEPAPVEKPKPVLIESRPEPEVIPVPAEVPTTLPLKPEYPVHGPVNYDEDSSNTVSSQLCTSGMAADEDGCCAGENLQFVESMNGYACCAVADGECYPPLK